MKLVPVEQMADNIRAIDDPVLKGKIHKALHLLHRTLELYKHQDISLSFNGGKDSTVLLHLMRVALRPGLNLLPVKQQQQQEQQQQQQPPNHSTPVATQMNTEGLPQQLQIQRQQQTQQSVQQKDLQQTANDRGLGGLATFYFERSDDFPEVREFVRETDRVYGLNMHFLTHPDFKAGLEEYLTEARTAAIVLGTRRGDPNADGQEYFCPSSAGWPPFMRINPILDWSYADVWGFLRACGVPYCCLYDQGYTSLGGVHNTLPNSALKKSDGTFAPAHILADGRLERAGRATKQRRSDSLPSGGAAGVSSSMSWVAGIVVIGDEMLSGKVEDTNTPFLCKELHRIGWTVRKVVFVPDDVPAIASEVASLSASCQAVITSGGVGPTLDDVTMEGIAAAFGVDVIRHPDLEESLLNYFGDHSTPAHLKMADTPGDDTIRLIPCLADNGTHSPFPLVAVRNVFVLPGVPHLLRQKWAAVAAELQAAVQLAPFSNRVVRLAAEDEAAVAPLLDTLAAEWGGELAIGSYPVSGQRDGARLLVTLESKQTDRLDSALARFQELLPHGTVIASQSDVSSLSGGTGATAGSNVSRRNSLGSLQQAMGGSCRCLCPSPKPVAATAAEAAAVTAEAAAMQLTVELAAAQVDGKL